MPARFWRDWPRCIEKLSAKYKDKLVAYGAKKSEAEIEIDSFFGFKRVDVRCSDPEYLKLVGRQRAYPRGWNTLTSQRGIERGLSPLPELEGDCPHCRGTGGGTMQFMVARGHAAEEWCEIADIEHFTALLTEICIGRAMGSDH